MTTTTTNEVEPAPFMASEGWIEAFEHQNTDDMRKRAKRFARSRARHVARVGGRGDDLYVAELVHDVLTDTLFGILSWDPAVVPLEVHVFGAIRCRTKNDRIRALRFRHHSIDAVGAGDSATAMSAAMCEVETSLAASHSAPSPESLTFTGEVLEHVRGLAADDRDILRIIDAIELGATEPAEIMSVASMSEKTYKKARLRLGRVVEQLSNHVLLGARCNA
jgi:hypothetical protein